MKKILFWLSAMIALLLACTACEEETPKSSPSYSVTFKTNNPYLDENGTFSPIEIMEYDYSDKLLVSHTVAVPRNGQTVTFTPHADALAVKFRTTYDDSEGVTIHQWLPASFPLERNGKDAFEVDPSFLSTSEEPSGQYNKGTKAEVSLTVDIPAETEPYDLELSVFYFNDQGKEVGIRDVQELECTKTGKVVMNLVSPMTSDAVAFMVYLWCNHPQQKVEGYVKTVFPVKQGKTVKQSFTALTPVQFTQPEF